MTFLQNLIYITVPKAISFLFTLKTQIGGDDEPFTLDAPSSSSALQSGSSPVSLGATLIRMFISLGIVLIIIIGIYYIIKRFSKVAGNPIQGSEGIEILSTRLLGGRKSLMLVKCGKKKVLLGTASDNITFLTEISGEKSEKD